MSVALLAVSSIFIHPFELSMADVVFTAVRDIGILTWYTSVLVQTYLSNNYQCLSASGVSFWLWLAIITTILRLIKNPMQYIANQRLDNNGNNWNNPVDIRGWVRFFVPSYYILQMRTFTFLDTMGYIPWVLGLAILHPLSGCQTEFEFRVVYLEIFLSTGLYVVSVILFALTFGLHRWSRGKCFPGLQFDRDEDSCPWCTFDRTLWRRSDESRVDWAIRVEEEFERQEQIFYQPDIAPEMVIKPSVLTATQLKELKEFKYSLDEKINLPMANIPTPEPALCGPLKGDTAIEMKDMRDNSEHSRTTDDVCALCIEEYIEGELVRELHCGHRYHSDCVDSWLLESKRTCPVCNSDALGTL